MKIGPSVQGFEALSLEQKTEVLLIATSCENEDFDCRSLVKNPSDQIRKKKNLATQ
jgi:hypothetical protein